MVCKWIAVINHPNKNDPKKCDESIVVVVVIVVG